MWNKDAKTNVTCPNCKTVFVITGKQLINKEIISCPNCKQQWNSSKVLKEIEDIIKKHRSNKTINIEFKL
jgi:predicted Zn finger-like uncharacterized protein